MSKTLNFPLGNWIKNHRNEINYKKALRNLHVHFKWPYPNSEFQFLNQVEKRRHSTQAFSSLDPIILNRRCVSLVENEFLGSAQQQIISLTEIKELIQICEEADYFDLCILLYSLLGDDKKISEAIGKCLYSDSWNILRDVLSSSGYQNLVNLVNK